MEDFTFEIIKRRLGARLDMQESDELQSLEFNKYKVASIEFQSSKKVARSIILIFFHAYFFQTNGTSVSLESSLLLLFTC